MRLGLALLAALCAAPALAQPATEVTVIRPKAFIASETSYYVVIDGKALYDLASREHVRFTVSPGRHVLAVHCPKALSANYAETRIEQEFQASVPAFFVLSAKFNCVSIDPVDATRAAGLIASSAARPAGRPVGYAPGRVETAAPVLSGDKWDEPAVAVAPATPATSSQAAGDIAAATAAWAEAFNSRDAARLGALYESDAVLTDTGETRPRVGAAAIGDYYKSLARRETQRIALGERSIRVFGDTAIDSGNCTYFEMRDGKATTAPGRYSLTYRNHGGKWMIVDHHLSLLPH
jgi:uncharacterized protein (TIGR02246 family)